MALSFIKRVFTFGKDAPPQEDKDTPELTKAVNGAIEKLKADGTYDQIVKKWFSANAK